MRINGKTSESAVLYLIKEERVGNGKALPAARQFHCKDHIPTTVARVWMRVVQSLLVLLFVSTENSVLADIDFGQSVHCEYQTGQIMDKDTAKNVKNSTPLVWVFNGLETKNPIFISGGDSGSVYTQNMVGGIAIYFPHSYASSSFTIWQWGESFWAKHSNLLSRTLSQQFIGKCENR